MLSTAADPRRATGRLGFTLVELLVTIGIIAALVGILIPVATRIRRSAQVAETQNMINRIQAAITAYQQEHGAYPGVFRNDEVAPNNGGANQQVRATSSENLILSLLGGLDVTFNGSNVRVGYSGTASKPSDEVGKGPMSLNWRKPQRHRAYMDAQPGDLSTSRSDTNLGSTVPEFIDRFPSPKALIYLRANVGARNGPLGNDETFQYNGSHMEPYAGTFTQLFGAGKAFGSPEDYFVEPGTNQAKQKDAYMLISAGPDGVYGTKDDITNFGL